MLTLDQYLLVPQIVFADEKAFLEWTDGLDLSAQIALSFTLNVIGDTNDIRSLARKLIKELHSGICQVRIGKTLKEALNTVRAEKPKSLAGLSDLVLLRVFFAEIGDASLLVLSAYDKRSDRSNTRQSTEIGKALDNLHGWLLQNDVL